MRKSEKIRGSLIKNIETFGKNIVISFSFGVYTWNHMMKFLFQVSLCPFIKIGALSNEKRMMLVYQIPKILSYEYLNDGRTRLTDDSNDNVRRWISTYWVYRRAGHVWWECGQANIQMDRKKTCHITYWCPICQNCYWCR